MTKISIFCKKHLYLYFFALLFTILLNRSALEALTICGTLVSFYLLATNWKFFFNELKANRYLYLSLGFLIPIGLSLTDTLNMGKALSVFLKMLRYVFIGVLAVAMTMSYGKKNFTRLTQLSFYMLMFICIDAIMQWLTGYHIYGYNPVSGNRVMGIFGDSAHLSYFLGTFAPIVLFYLYKINHGKKSLLKIMGGVIALSLLIIGVVIGGARAGFLSLTVSIFLFIAFLFYKGKIKHKLRFIGGFILVIAISIGVLSQSDIVKDRFTTTTSNFGSEEFFDQFSSKRTTIWEVGFKEIPNYWINGIGPRAFDKVYQTYPEDYKVFQYVWQPHLHALEVMIETGIIGFIPYLLILGYLLIRMFTARAGNEWIMMGFVAMMPINSHVGLYEGFWMPIIWVPIMLGLAQAHNADKELSLQHNL